jgi:hypothetical protein
MPLTKTGSKVKKAMAKTYGKKKGEQVFYATMNKAKKQWHKKSAKKT